MTREELISEIMWLGYNDAPKGSISECKKKAQKMFDEYEKANSSDDIQNVSDWTYCKCQSVDECEDLESSVIKCKKMYGG